MNRTESKILSHDKTTNNNHNHFLFSFHVGFWFCSYKTDRWVSRSMIEPEQKKQKKYNKTNKQANSRNNQCKIHANIMNDDDPQW